MGGQHYSDSGYRQGASSARLHLGEILRNPQTAAEAKAYASVRVADGRFVPKVAKTFPLDEVVNAHRYLESAQQMGRVAITIA